MRDSNATKRSMNSEQFQKVNAGLKEISLADLHMHTTASDGSLSPQALVNAVLSLQMQMTDTTEPILRVIAVTDHDTLAGAWTAMEYLEAYHSTADLEIVPGSEISTTDGHILALGIRNEVPRGLSAEATIHAIHEQYGLAIAAHPYAYFPFLQGLKGIKNLIAHPVVGRSVDAVEVCNANPTEILNNHLTRWINRTRLRRPEVGGSDSHFHSAVARAGTVFPGRSAADLMKAIREGTTRAVGGVYGPLKIIEYLRDRLAWKQFCLADPVVRVRHDW
jgi:predicted metal-dependent phosphoesterase TrpH